MGFSRSFQVTGIILGLGLLLSAGTSEVAADAPRLPNIVLIMTDNQGAWSLGCYGNPDIKTPHIDRMAEEGIRFARAFSNNAVCSPTRASFLTGLMPSQHGVHKYIGGDVMLGPKAYGTLDEFDTLPQILNERGYVCGLSGKWHLGNHLEPQEGFSFWVTKPGGHSTGFVNQEIIENGEIRTEPSHQTDYWTKRGIEFIDRNQDHPFFLFLAYNGPYGLGKSALSEPTNRHAEYYSDKELGSFPRNPPSSWLHNNKQMLNNPTSMRKYASEVSGVDDGVGAILEALSDRGLDDNTLVMFTADQGLAGGQGGFWGMGDHTRPLTAYDPMIRIPLIARHPGRIPGGRQSDLMVANYDVMPTLLGYLGLEPETPSKLESPESPGRSFARELLGEGIEWENSVFYEFENLRAIRTDEWKYIERFGDEPDELYHLAVDPEEQDNLVGREEHSTTQKNLREKLYAFFDRYSDPKWDLWKGGEAKGGLLLGKAPYEKEADEHGPDKEALLFSFFRGNGEEGLFLATSADGLRWEEIGKDRVWLAPEVGESVLMRDPCITRGPDGLFHMVWTPGWKERGIGYARSADLVHWSGQKYIEVMGHEPTARNAWAPEVFYDEATERFLIFWATTIPARFPETEEAGDDKLNHRMYFVTTEDFKTFSDTKLFFDPGFNVIDSTLLSADKGRYTMFLKNETRRPPEKNIRVATATRAEGPYGEVTAPITGDYWAEGPTAIRIGEYWYVYFDKYRKDRFGAVRSKDLVEWEDVSDRIEFPEGGRHGTVFRAPREILEGLRKASASADR